MEKSDEILIERHIRDDAELERYVEEHKQFEEGLEAFHRRIHLTPEEEVKKKVLQKKKLLGKERIFSILEKYRQT
ncbi:MAG: DUF465 domain-containing protein [Deltaproteobacteria bacterium]|nr:DUF465 domain-containing protein [Deltaproteobacteria bacterium]